MYVIITSAPAMTFNLNFPLTLYDNDGAKYVNIASLFCYHISKPRDFSSLRSNSTNLRQHMI